MFEDKTLVCVNCGAEFVFTKGEQEFYANTGLQNEPKRCKDCRKARKDASKAPKELHETVCYECGAVAKVPFVPSNDNPVYCSECFAKRKNQ